MPLRPLFHLNCRFEFREQPTLIFLMNVEVCWNKHGGGAKDAKSLNMEVKINVEGGIFWKKLVNNSNKRGVEGGIFQNR